jgi:hypothetical protein
MIIRRAIQTGIPKKLNLHARISALTRKDRVSGFKIGITCDPEARVRGRTYSNTYDEMVVLYKTDSLDRIRAIEAMMTEYHHELSDNIKMGGAGRSGTPPYYLYVVIKKQVF